MKKHLIILLPAILAAALMISCSNEGNLTIGNWPTPVPTDTPVTLVLQYGLNTYTGTVDTHISQQNPGANYVNQSGFVIGNQTSGEWRTLIKFSLAAIPQGAAIVSAQLELYRSSYIGDIPNIDIYRINEGWDGTVVTWTTAPVECIYHSYVNMTSTTVAFPLSTLMVQEWVNDPSLNNGILLLEPDSPDDDDIVTFYSSNSAATVNHPKLTVVYRP